MGEATTGYEERGPGLGPGLGPAYLGEVARVPKVIAAAPDHYPVLEGSMRKAVSRRFPYLLLSRAEDDEVVVISCFHTHRNQKEWRQRL